MLDEIASRLYLANLMNRTFESILRIHFRQRSRISKELLFDCIRDYFSLKTAEQLRKGTTFELKGNRFFPVSWKGLVYIDLYSV